MTYQPGSLNYREIEKIASNILHEYSVNTPPVPIKDMIESRGVDVVFAQFNKMRGQIAGFTDFNSRAIYVNTEDSLKRKTFTMAHEYGHWILHKSLFEEDPEKYGVLLRTHEKSDDPYEKEANAFAAHLLVPNYLLKPILGVALRSQLSVIFAVSDEVIAHRLKHV